MGFIKGQQLLFMGPATAWLLVDFIENDEGWSKVRFSDKSETTVRPSHVRPLNDRTMDLVLDEYARIIATRDPITIECIALTASRVADAIRWVDLAHGNRLTNLQAMAQQALRA